MGPRLRPDVVDALIADRAPQWRLVDADVDALAMAIALAAARAGTAVVQPRFVADLRRQLADRLDAGDCGESRPAIGRRRVLKAVGVAAAAAVGGGIAEGIRLQAPGSTKKSVNVADDGAWRTVASSAELDEVGVVRFADPAAVGFLARTGGVLRAVSGVCTHQGCLLQYRENDQELECPCHRATFALTGEVRTHDVPAPLPPLPQLPVRERDGRIEVYLATPTDGPPKPKPLQA
jgi:cytochrome b6-f complex iron-sulfur subunit